MLTVGAKRITLRSSSILAQNSSYYIFNFKLKCVCVGQNRTVRQQNLSGSKKKTYKIMDLNNHTTVLRTW
jgi:hypothetical protein